MFLLMSKKLNWFMSVVFREFLACSCFKPLLLWPKDLVFFWSLDLPLPFLSFLEGPPGTRPTPSPWVLVKAPFGMRWGQPPTIPPFY